MHDWWYRLCHSYIILVYDRFKDVNVRLRRLVAEERRALTQLRQSYAQELRTRTEMELLLRQCVEDIREAIADKLVDIYIDIV